MPKTSIIIPAYNAEKYIKAAIESVLAQTDRDLELIIVDDGSKDGTGAICDSYASEEKVTVIHKENGGPILARRDGVAASSGEWLAFLDADDTLSPDFLEKLHALSDGADIVIGEFRERSTCETRQLDAHTYRRMMLRNVGETLVCLWGHIYRRELFTPEVFMINPRLLVGEDWATNIRLSFNVKRKIVTTYDKIYNYTEDNPDSILHVTPKKAPEVLDFLRGELIRAIPADKVDEYIWDITWKELLELDWFLHKHPGDHTYMKTEFFRHILEDVKRSGISMPYWLDEIIRHDNSFIANKIAYLKRHFRKKKEKDIFTGIWPYRL